MSTLVVGDVHGCADELAQLLRIVKPSRLISVGDLFTRGPDPVGVWEQVRGADAVMGNHEDWMLRHWEDGDSKQLATLRRKHPEVRAWIADLPLMRFEGDHIVVHAGLHPVLGTAGTSFAMATRMRRWPDDKDKSNPFWYDAGWNGPQKVVFGHDAMRGLVRRPYAVGLDSGCVYGNALSGYILEEQRVISVKARKAWFPSR